MALFTMLTLSAGSALAEGSSHGAEPEAATPKAIVAPVEPEENYCANIADKAREARYVLLDKSLADARAALETEKQALAAERAGFDALRKKREAEFKAVQKGVIDIYAKMKPDAAAAQLEVIGVDTASAILRELNVRAASTILNEMSVESAAKISKRLASAAGLPQEIKTP